jgi:uncharacterized protein YaaN involved in tellurite resistance
VILSAYQASIAVRMMGDNELIIRQKLSDIRTELLPQWRTLIAIAYQAYQQEGIARFVQKLTRSESDLRRQVADQLEETAEGVAELMTRPLFDYEAMKYSNDKLVRSLDILKTASIEAKKIRGSAEKEMQGLISQLGEASLRHLCERNRGRMAGGLHERRNRFTKRSTTTSLAALIAYVWELGGP